MKKLISLSMLLITGMVIISCGGKTGEKDSKASATEDSKNTKSDDFLRSSGGIEEAFDKLKAMDKFKGKKIMVFKSIHFYGEQGGRIAITIADPDKPQNVDEYIYSNGSWGDPEPVKLTGIGELSENLINLDEINYKAVPDMMKIVDEGKTIEGAKVDDHLYFTFNPTFNTKVFKMGTIQGTRETYDIQFDINGNLKEFVKL